MGLITYAEGEIFAIDNEAAIAIENVLNERGYFEYCIASDNIIDIWRDEDIHWEDEYIYLFEHTYGLIKSGEIRVGSFRDGLWCFVYNPHTNGWEERPGRVVYDKGSINELTAALIDGLEDFLTKKGVWFPNPERDGEDPDVDPESVALIYGTDYGTLQTYIEDTLRNFGLI